MADKKFFLLWFFYINSVIGLILLSYWMGIFQLGFQYDKSYLSFVILGWWVVAESVIGLNVWNQTREFKCLNGFKKQLAIGNNLNSVLAMPQFNNSLVANYAAYMLRRYENSKQSFDQTQMAAALERKLMNRNSFGWLASNLIVFLGLLGTVIGIVLTFWPFINTSVAIDIARIQTHLSSIFAGVGAAFFPSIYSAIFCVFILISDRISNNSTHALLNELMAVLETDVIAHVEYTNADTQ